jgi:hypothetical protein
MDTAVYFAYGASVESAEGDCRELTAYKLHWALMSMVS